MDDSVGMQFVADLESLTDFFQAVPALEYPDLPVYNNCVTVETKVDDKTIWLMFVPFQGFGELRIVGSPFSVIKLEFSDISHLAVRKTAEDHWLTIRFARKKTNTLRLKLRPHVLLFWGNGEDGEDIQREILREANMPPTHA